MGLLKKLGGGQGYLKAGFLGFQASGKTYTSMLLALGTRQHFGLSGSIAMFDTEGGSEYIAKKIEKETGKDFLGVRAHSLGDLLAVGKECVKDGVSVLIVDSVTHIWRELCDAYLIEVNDARKRKNLYPRKKLEFQDWNPIKAKWAEWTDFYLNSPLHIIICGRAGFEYDYEKNEETNQKELIKTGIKMKTESEFGFEPSLLIEMEREQVSDGDGRFLMRRVARVVKDRFNVIDGKTCENPTFTFFKPHLDMLTPGAVATIDTAVKTEIGVDEAGDDQFARLRHRRKVGCEEIEGTLAIIWPSSQGKDKQARFAVLSELAGTTSEAELERKPPEQLEHMAKVLKVLSSEVLNGSTWENLVELKKHVKSLSESLRHANQGELEMDAQLNALGAP